MEIWLVILFLSRKKFDAKQIFVVLSSSLKLGPGLVCLATCIKIKYKNTKNSAFIQDLWMEYVNVSKTNHHTVLLVKSWMGMSQPELSTSGSTSGIISEEDLINSGESSISLSSLSPSLCLIPPPQPSLATMGSAPYRKNMNTGAQ